MSILRSLSVCLALAALPAAADPVRQWAPVWPRTDFERTAVTLDEIRPGGPERDGIPPVDRPGFVTVDQAAVPGVEPVVSVEIGGDARAYPLRILIWHQIVNDRVGGVPVTVTYCPLSNVALVFERRAGGDTVEFGSTGLLRHANLVMYDRQTESWWQQYEGRAIVGAMAGARLRQLPARLESMGLFAERLPQGRVLVPTDPDARPYGRNPYPGYDSMPSPYYHEGPPPEGLAPLARVVRIGDRAWSLALVRARRHLELEDLQVDWTPGQSSALDAKQIADGRDVGNVVVRQWRHGVLSEIPYTIEFAFVFKAFHPDKEIIIE